MEYKPPDAFWDEIDAMMDRAAAAWEEHQRRERPHGFTTVQFAGKMKLTPEGARKRLLRMAAAGIVQQIEAKECHYWQYVEGKARDVDKN